MNTTYSKDQKAAALAQLPEPIRDAILSLDMAETFQTLMKKYDLRIDATQTIAEATFLVLVGLEQPSILIQEIRKIPPLSEEQATNLIQELNKNIFGPVRGHILTPHTGEEPSTALKDTAPTIPRDTMEAKLKGTVHAPLETDSHTTPPPTPKPYGEGDPYREPIE